jgi:hypothetical protein
MTILKKSDILQGIDTPKKIQIESLQGEIWLRPLSSAEVDEILNIEAEGFGTFNAKSNRGQTNAEAKMNLPKMQEKQAEAKYIAIHKSINNPKNNDEWEITEIKTLPADAVNEIYNKVMDLSGASVTTRDVENFPED